MLTISVPVISQDHLAAKGFFYVGGGYQGAPGKTFYAGQMFVEVYVPREIRHPYPLIFFHGAGQSNLNWLGTPDGRMGWADWFAKQGYVVYLAEQPARGRSAYHPEADGPRRYHAVEDIERRFAGTGGSWETAKLHTQWPETAARMGMPLFDQFAAAQLEFVADHRQTQERILAAAGPLLEKTGPAVLITHSQAGPFGWLIGDTYPDFVKGIVALEPAGPPFGIRPGSGEVRAQNYGLCELPLHFEPELRAPEEFVLEKISSDRPEEREGWEMTSGWEYKLPNLGKVPVLMLTAEASYHSQFDYLTAHVLRQMGVDVNFVRLQEAGFHGNSHFMMLEKNNLEIADYMKNWLVEQTEQG